jgi:hypothetical protein
MAMRKKTARAMSQAKQDAAGMIANNSPIKFKNTQQSAEFEKYMRETSERVRITFEYGQHTERMWAEPVQNGYRLMNIPFFVPGIALYDIVSATRNAEGALVADDMVEESGHMTVNFATKDKLVEQTVLYALKKMGCGGESMNADLGVWAIDLPDEDSQCKALAFLCYVRETKADFDVLVASHDGFDLDDFWKSLKESHQQDVDEFVQSRTNLYAACEKWVKRHPETVVDRDTEEELKDLIVSREMPGFIQQ